MSQPGEPQSYVTVCFQILAYEFKNDDPKEFDKKIRRKLKSSGLGLYDPERIAVIRSLKNELRDEIKKFARSKYFLNAPGPYSAPTDFDRDRMITDLSLKYPSIEKSDLYGILNFALYLYYLR